MNDGVSSVEPVEPVDPDTAADVAPEATVPKQKVARQKAPGPEAREEPKPDSLLFFSGLLKTHRSMEREARAAKISSMRIV
jgi:hypothetical protein